MRWYGRRMNVCLRPAWASYHTPLQNYGENNVSENEKNSYANIVKMAILTIATYTLNGISIKTPTQLFADFKIDFSGQLLKQGK